MILYGEQRTPEWFAARLGVATASEFDAVMAKGRSSGEATTRRNYRWLKALERLTGKPADSKLRASFDMQRGIDLEEEALAAFEIATETLVDRVLFVRHDELQIGCSPDGLIGDGAGLEIKCPNAATHGTYLQLPPGMPPAEYWWQVYGSMLVTGRAAWFFVSYHPEFPAPLQLHHTLVRRDEKELAKLQSGLLAFENDVQATVDELQAMIEARQ